MASITFDGQSFMLDGRRVWLVSGSIPYAQVPRAQWADRINAAKQAGLNCIETTVVWSRHEARQGHFDFKGDNDLRHFVQQIAQAGLWCILRPGPYIDGGWDLGGLPPWLLTNEQVKLRTSNQAFLEACSRFITALAGQLRDLQVNSATPKHAPAGHHPGPIILLQTEQAWTCGDDTLAHAYLGELDRYFREAGFSVPIINANDLWQSAEGQIDGWTGLDGMLSHLRQLGTIRPAQPRVVIEFRVGERRVWGRAARPALAPAAVVRRLAEVLAAGGQFNITPFHGGTYFGFGAGRDSTLGPDGFLCTSNDGGAPLNELGAPTRVYHAVRRICTFASRFSRVLSHLDPARQPVTLLPDSVRVGRGPKASMVSPPGSVSVVHAVGSQGGVVFVFGNENSSQPAAGSRRIPGERLSLLLPDGSTLPVELGEQSVGWCLLDTRLTGRANLDYMNLCALALVGRVLVCFGPAGSRAMLSINGAPFETVVPEGKLPFIHEHEGIVVVVASERQVDELAIDDAGVYIGVSGIDRHGHPIPHPDHRQWTRLDPEGKSTSHRVGAPTRGGSSGGAIEHEPKPARVHKPSLGEWQLAEAADYCAGTSARFAAIAKPADLVSLGAPYGYGWYRIKFTNNAGERARLMFPHAAHRAQLWLDGEPLGVVGAGPGAGPLVLPVSLRKGPHTLVALAENFGRVSSGADLGEPVGLYGQAWEVEPIRAGKPRLVASDPIDVLAFRSPLWRMHRDDMTDAQRLTWRFEHRRKTSIIVDIGRYEEAPPDAGPRPTQERDGGVLLLNGKPVHYFQQGGVKPVFLDQAILARGINEFQIVMLGSTEAHAHALEKAVHFYEAVDSPTARGEWAFAKWEPPGADAFHKSGRHPAGPCWWRCPFNAGDADAPLLLDCSGLSKGQIYVNNRHVGRFFVATGNGRHVGPQTNYLIPRAYLSADGEDELLIFEEHGHTPARCRLIADFGASTIEA